MVLEKGAGVVMKRRTRIVAWIVILMMIVTWMPTTQIQASGLIKESNLTLFVGETANLTLTKNITNAKWISKNPKVVTVNKQGKITAKKAGKTKIMVTGSRKGVCTVTVKDKPFLNSSKIRLDKKETYTLKLAGCKVKKWSSSNKKIAKVSSKGKITAVKYGTAIIKAKAANGKTYSCKVLVEPKDKNISASMLYVEVNDKTFNLKKNFENINCNREYYTIKFDKLLSEYGKGVKKRKYSTKFTIKKEGTYMAQYKITSAAGDVHYVIRMIKVVKEAP